MRDDVARTRAYRQAIMAAAPGKIVVDIGTGALALLAIIAADAGAQHVYAIEVQSAAAAAARRAVAAAGHADRITVIEGFSTDDAVVLPIRAHLMIHELIGEIAGEEGAVRAILDAARRHMHPSAQRPFSIPARACTFLAPCEYPDASYCVRVPGAMLRCPGAARALKLPQLMPRDRLLATSQRWEDLSFSDGAPEPTQTAELTFTLDRAGLLAGFVLHVELHCKVDAGDGRPPDVSSAWPGSHWRNVFLTIDEAAPVRAGQRVRVRTSAELAAPTPVYEFEAWLEERAECAEAGAGGEWSGHGGSVWRSLGPRMAYPEASLNCNDMMDHLMAA
jgi:protein arginine N-methyltransferase 1